MPFTRFFLWSSVSFSVLFDGIEVSNGSISPIWTRLIYNRYAIGQNTERNVASLNSCLTLIYIFGVSTMSQPS